MTRTRWGAAVVMTAIALNSGCATIEYRNAGSTERVLSTRQAPESVGFVPEVSQDGTLLQARLTTDCRVRPYETVEATTRFEAVNTTPGRDWAFGISGAALAGLGVWGILDASKTYTNDVHSRTYNPVGPEAAKGVGIGALVAGGALLTVAAVDVVLAMQGKSKISTEELAREAGSRCQGAPMSNATVMLTASGQQIVAPTDPNGTANFDLQEVRSPSGPVTIGVPIGKGVETKEVAVNWAPVVSQRRAAEALVIASAAEATKAAKLSADTKQVEQIEAAVVSVERILAKLEGTRTPWGDAELKEVIRMKDLFSEVPQHIAALQARTPIDPTLNRRLGPLTLRIRAVGSRAAALAPRVEKAAEARKMRNVAFLTALLNAGASSSSSSSASSYAPSSDDSRIREIEERRQHERAEDNERHERQRKEDEDRRQNEKRQQLIRCHDECYHEEATCENEAAQRHTIGDCYNKKKACESRCDATYGR